MDSSFFTTPLGIAVVAPIGALVAGLVGPTISARTTKTTHSERLAADERLADKKFAFDKQLAERRAAEEMALLEHKMEADIALHREKLATDKRLAERKAEVDIALAKQKADYDRQQAVFRRRFELAEQFLSDAYRFRSMMRFVRSSVSFQGEGETRPAQGAESNAVKRARNNYFVPRERLHAENEFLAAMFARQTTCHAHFGNDADNAFVLLHETVHLVRTASSLLVEWTDDHEQVDRKLMEKLQRDIWQPVAVHAGKDEIGDKVEEAVQIIERLCQPVLAWVDVP